MTQNTLSPDRLLNLGAAFSASRVLLSAIELDLFSLLTEPHTAEQLRVALHLHARSVPDFPDTLVALGILNRKGSGSDALYSNTPEAQLFLAKSSPAYMAGILELCATTLYEMWGHLTTVLKTGNPPLEVYKRNGGVEGDELWDLILGGSNGEKFVNAMVGINTAAHRAFAQRFDFSSCDTLLDIGGSSGGCCCEVAKYNKRLMCITLDLLPMEKFAKANVEAQGLENRVIVKSGDYMKDDFEKADVIVMSHILHSHDEDQKKYLVKKAFDALSTGGRLVILETLIDNDRRESVAGLIMSLNMLVATISGSNFSARDFDSWAREAGYGKTEFLPLTAPVDAVVAYKQ